MRLPEVARIMLQPTTTATRELGGIIVYDVLLPA